jgi:hypothetical protein
VLEPKLAYRLLVGSNIGATYRQRGPRAQSELARKQIYHLPLVRTPFQTADLAAPCALRWIGCSGKRRIDGRGALFVPHTAAGAASLV